MKQLSEYSFADLWAMWNFWERSIYHNVDRYQIEKEIHKRLDNTDFKPVTESKSKDEGNPSNKD